MQTDNLDKWFLRSENFRLSNKIFDKLIINFLSELSNNILTNNKNRKYIDLNYFGFWCRKQNLLKIYKDNFYEKNRVGVGIIYHVPPSNVPLNFAYSLSFGLLSGNINIVRLPSKNFLQINIICKIIKKLLLKKKFNLLKNKIIFIKYPSTNNKISEFISNKVDGRIIWGGDRTVNLFKNLKTRPKCVNLYFPDRYSISLVNSNKINRKNIDDLVKKFYDDTLTMDQMGCSSPIGVVWLGKKKDMKNLFWKKLDLIIRENYDSDFEIINLKLNNLFNLAINKNININNLEKKYSSLFKFKTKDINADFKTHNFGFGTFFEAKINSIREIKKLSNKKLQTLTTFGVNPEKIIKEISFINFQGIDRIVPIGRAFDMSVIWDGQDIIRRLSRIISF